MTTAVSNRKDIVEQLDVFLLRKGGLEVKVDCGRKITEI